MFAMFEARQFDSKGVSTSPNRDITELEKVLLAPAEILGERLVL